MSEETRLARSLCERMCHDLSGLVGTLANLLTLAQESPGDSVEIVAVAGDAAMALAARLRLLRGAWVGLTAPLHEDALRALLPGLPGAERLTLDAAGIAFPLPPVLAQTVLNLLLVAAQALPWGGGIVLRAQQGGRAMDGCLVLSIAGRGAAWPPGFAACVADPQLALATACAAGSSDLQPPLAAALAHGVGVRLSWLLAGPAPLPLLLQASSAEGLAT